jgi:hypothetical protein
MAKKKIDIPDDLTSKMVGAPLAYPTPSVMTPIYEQVAPRNVGGRPIKESSIGRTKYTTALSKDQIRFLRVEAAKRDLTPADLLEIIISDYQKQIEGS